MHIKSWITSHVLKGGVMGMILLGFLCLLPLLIIYLFESLFIPHQPLSHFLFIPLFILSLLLGFPIGAVIGFILSLPTLPMAPLHKNPIDLQTTYARLSQQWMALQGNYLSCLNTTFTTKLPGVLAVSPVQKIDDAQATHPTVGAL